MKFATPTWTFTLPKIRVPPGFPKVRIGVKTRPRAEWAFIACFVIYSFVCIAVYWRYVDPWIAGRIDTRIGADSDRLWAFAEAARHTSDTNEPLISFTSNLLGPVIVGIVLQSGVAVMAFNFLLFFIALKVVGSIPQINKALVAFLFLANLELLPALTTLNKEIFATLGAVLTAKYLYSDDNPKWLLLLVVLVCAFARWEQVACLLLYFLLTRFPFRNRPWPALLVLVGVITIVYPFIFKLVGVDPGAFDWLYEGATTLIWLNKIQNNFGFALLVVPKILMTMTGELHSPQYYHPAYWRENFSLDPQNLLFLPMHCVVFTIVFFYALWTGRLDLKRPIAMLSALTLIATAATPFIQPRYIYGVYALLCIDIARPREIGFRADVSAPQSSAIGVSRASE